MEEKKIDETPKQEKRELTYDELKNAATQISAQAQALFKENRELKVVLQKADLSNTFSVLECMFKVLNYAEMFDTEFVGKCADSIKNTLTLIALEEPKKEKEEAEEETDNKE